MKRLLVFDNHGVFQIDNIPFDEDAREIGICNGLRWYAVTEGIPTPENGRDPSREEIREASPYLLGNLPDDITALLDNSSVRKPEIEARLTAIDIAKVRPLTAIVGGAATDSDTRKLADLEAEDADLRDVLLKL
jgi:hypothetical protein